MRRLQIALVIPGIPHGSGGPSVAVTALAKHLAGAGHEVAIVTTDLGPYGSPSGPLVEVDGKVDLKLFPVRSRWSRRLYRSVELRQWLHQNIHNFDVVDIQGIWSFVTIDAARACLHAGVPYVLTPRGQMARWDWEKGFRQKHLFFTLFLQKVWRSAAAIRLLSQGEVSHAMVEAGDRGIIIPNPISLPEAKDTESTASHFRRELNIPQDAAVLLFLGRVTAQKGVLELLEAFRCLSERRKDIYLVIVGPLDGHYGDIVAERIQDLPCQQNVRLLGPLYDSRKYGAFAGASLFVTLSKNEGLPVAALEAMAWGLPVVLTEQSNFPEVEEYSTGIIVKANPDNVATSLERLLNNPTQLKQMRLNASRLIEEHFTWEKVLPQLLALYERVAQKRRSVKG